MRAAVLPLLLQVKKWARKNWAIGAPADFSARPRVKGAPPRLSRFHWIILLLLFSSQIIGRCSGCVYACPRQRREASLIDRARLSREHHELRGVLGTASEAAALRFPSGTSSSERKTLGGTWRDTSAPCARSHTRSHSPRIYLPLYCLQYQMKVLTVPGLQIECMLFKEFPIHVWRVLYFLL